MQGVAVVKDEFKYLGPTIQSNEERQEAELKVASLKIFIGSDHDGQEYIRGCTARRQRGTAGMVWTYLEHGCSEGSHAKGLL